MEDKTGCIIMASGMGTRFGSNKLLAGLGGIPVAEHVMDTACRFAQSTGVTVSVATRWREVAELAESKGLSVLFHSYTAKSDVIRLCVSHAADAGWAACMFMLGDQPLLRADSVERLYKAYREGCCPGKVFRLGYGGVPGSPVIFSSCHYKPLMALTGEQGGMSVFGAADTVIIPADAAYEMIDIDTAEDLERAAEIYAEIFT